jgi:metallophosphoesterase superfamily enzyme
MSKVLVVGDTHAPGMRKGYVDFLSRIAERHKTDRVVHIGDLVDWCSINFHERHPGNHNPSREYERARQQVDTLSRRFPKADWLIGNHDALTERQAVAVGLPSVVLRDYQSLWGVKWRVHERFAKLVIDGVIYAHGDSGRGGQDAALNQARDNFQSTVIGHWHAQAGVRWWANRYRRVFGMAVGCGIDASALQFAYGRAITAKPLLGCGVVLHGERGIWEPWLLPAR